MYMRGRQERTGLSAPYPQGSHAPSPSGGHFHVSSRYPKPLASSSALSARSLVTSEGKVRASASRAPPPPPSEEPSVSASASSNSIGGGEGGVDVHRVVTRRRGMSPEAQEAVGERFVETVG